MHRLDRSATLAMFPDLVHLVDDVYYRGNDNDGYVVAVRWTIFNAFNTLQQICRDDP